MSNIALKPEDIPVGKEHAITKYELCRRLGLDVKNSTDERKIRKLIAELRETDNGDNFVIVSSSHCRGFYRSDKLEDIKDFYRETSARAKHTFNPLKKARRLMLQNVEETGMNSKEAAEYLKISTRTLMRWVESGKLEHFKAGRGLLFDRNDIEKLKGD